MKAVVKADFFDVELGETRRAGDEVDMTEKRIDAINEVFPGTVEKVQSKKASK